MSDVLGNHLDRADGWLEDGYGDRLTQAERLSIIRVLFDRAWACKSEMDAQALLDQVSAR